MTTPSVITPTTQKPEQNSPPKTAVPSRSVLLLCTDGVWSIKTDTQNGDFFRETDWSKMEQLLRRNRIIIRHEAHLKYSKELREKNEKLTNEKEFKDKMTSLAAGLPLTAKAS